MNRGFVTLLLAAVAAISLADKWCFVVSGDGRTNDQTADPTGINLPVMKKLVDAINAEHPKFLIWTGDLVHGVYGKVTMPVEQQLETWKKTAAPLQGVAILPVRGNHETYGDPDSKVWLKQIRPFLDAAKVSYFKGEEGFSYSYTPPSDKKLTVIGVDQFIHAHRVNLPELEKALKKAKNAGAKNIMVFAHEMAFTCTSHGDDDNMSKFKADRDTFLELLELYGVRYFFAGHDHVYDWMVIKDKKWSSSYELNQIVAGTAGAPFYVDKGYFGDHGSYDLTRKEHLDNTFGYMLVEVDDNEGITVTFKAVTP